MHCAWRHNPNVLNRTRQGIVDLIKPTADAENASLEIGYRNQVSVTLSPEIKS
jgi:hypothetical protein